MSTIYTITDMQKIASEKGGKCLSKEYINSSSKLSWMCKRGHTWDNPYSLIYQGCWCIQCSKEDFEQEKLEDLHQLAKKHGGVCFAEHYKGADKKYSFKCANGHLFVNTPHTIKKGFWCKECKADIASAKRLRVMQAVAAKRNGLCLSTVYKRSNLNLKWQCQQGHVWQALPANIERGAWCPTCVKKMADEKQRKYSIAELQKYAAKLGGKVLSKAYRKGAIPLQWECKNKHKFLARAGTVVANESWCPKCKSLDIMRSNIQNLKSIAKSKKGLLLSDSYTDRKTRLKWQCHKGHVWLARFDNIKDGLWCPQCAKETELDRIMKEIHAYAKARGGRLFSGTYKVQETPLKWQCGKGHIWIKSWHNMRGGIWCWQCFLESRNTTVESFQKIAEAHGGKLLSKKYTNSTTKLKFKCAKGHIWSTLPGQIKVGHWCPECGIEAGIEKRKKFTVSMLQEYAKKLGGKLLSESYTAAKNKLQWECKKGHIWPASIDTVVYRGIWCKECLKRTNP